MSVPSATRTPHPSAHLSAQVAWWLSISTLVITGCGQPGSPTPNTTTQTNSTTAATTGTTAATTGKADAEKPRYTPEELGVIIQTFGAAQTMPERLTVSSTVPLAGSVSQKVDPAQTVITIDPPVQGKWVRRDRNTLEFTPTVSAPERSFQPSTTYTVTVKQLGAFGKAVTPEKPWTTRFTTPEFKFASMSTPIATSPTTIEVDLYFTGRPSAADLTELAHFEIDGAKAQSVNYSRRKQHVIHARITDDRAKDAKALKLGLAAGVPMSATIKAPMAQAQADIVQGPELSIKAASVSEGSSGYYVDVVCDDDAAPGGKRWYWSNAQREEYRVSRRCMPSEQALREAVSFNPPVKFEVATSAAGFRLFGDFKRGTYAMRVKPGLKSEDGGVLRQTFDARLTFERRKPRLNFVTKGRYMPRAAWKEIAFGHLNQTKVTATVRHIPLNNLYFWLGKDYAEDADTKTSIVVAKKEIPVRNQEDAEGTTTLKVSELVASPKPGVYEIKLEGTNDTSDALRVVVTDISLIAKRSQKASKDPWAREIQAWALGMHDLQPLVGAEIQAVRENGVVMAKCSAGRDGGCVLQLPAEDIDPSRPFVLVATKGDDFTYLKYAELRTPDPTNNSHGARSYLDEQPYTSVIYGDRDLYRPGEQGHFVAIVRDKESQAASGLPVQLKLRDARGRVVMRRDVTTNAAGMVSADASFPDFAPTGRWTLSVTAGEKHLASYGFGVEEFVPERMAVRAKPAQADVVAGQPLSINVQAKYLFGGSAEGSKVEVRCNTRRARFSPSAKNKDFTFGPSDQFSRASSMELGAASATISAADEATVACPSPELLKKFDHPVRVSASVSVFEAGSGRTTSRSTSLTAHPAAQYIGLKTDADKAKAGVPVKVQGVVVDWRGEPQNTTSEVEIEVVQLIEEYGYYYDEDAGRERWRYYRRPVRQGEVKTVKVANGAFSFEFTPDRDVSAFAVRARAGQLRTDLEITGNQYRYYWWSNDGEDRTPRPQAPSRVEIQGPDVVELDKKIKVTFDSPFKGRALITGETNVLLASQWKDVQAGPNEWAFSLDKFYPNVYLTVLIIKDPHLESKEAFMPARAFGVKSFKIRPTAHEHDVKLRAPSEVRSRAKLPIEIEVAGKRDGKVFATIAAVDEGILSLTRYKTPDPNASIFARRRLGVETFDTIGWALRLESTKKEAAKTGGDMDAREEAGELGRPKAIKPVALWSGLVDVGADGKARVDFDLPLYRGTLRVMAITADRSRIGRAEAQVLVRDPITLSSTLPRFLTAGDDVEVPVFVSNLSGKPRTVKVTMEAVTQEGDGALKTLTPPELVRFDGATEHSVTLADGKSRTVVFRARAVGQAGLVKFLVKATADELTSIDEQLVPLTPAGPRERMTKIIEVQQGANDLKPALEGWVPTSEHSTFWLTPIPYAQSLDHLKYLVRYPYGCIEQTTSATRPMLYITKLLPLIDPALADRQEKIKKMVEHGIRRVLAMQTSSGGFSYWPGGNTPDAWGTAYATHMLMDAQAQGYEVPRERLDAALTWLQSQAGRTSYPYAEPYMHYVLARAKRGKKARVLQLIKALPQQTRGEIAEREYLLKAALHLLGDQRYEAYLKSLDTTALVDDRQYAQAYYSDRRRRAMMLNVFMDLFGKDKAGEGLVQLVGRELSQQRSAYYTTQELVWGVTALGRWYDDIATSFSGARLLVKGNALKVSGGSEAAHNLSWSLYRASEYPTIELDLAQKGEGKLYLIVSSEGVREKPTARFGGNTLRVAREYFNAKGEPLSSTSIKLGEVVYVRVAFMNASDRRVENLALVERFPAGWEVENPNLGRGQLPKNLQENLWATQHKNIRDDRVEAFGTLYPKQTAALVIALRATSAGRFTSPAVSAEAMYEPKLWAREAGKTFTVVGPWSEQKKP